MNKKYYTVGAIALAFVLTAVTITSANISFKEMVARVAGTVAGERVADSLLEDIELEGDLIAGAFPGNEIIGDVTIQGIFTQGTRPYSTTTNSTATTLNASDLARGGLNLVTMAGAVADSADITYTFPASSTVRSIVPYVGARSEQCWMLTATTSDSQLIFAAGTGFDFRFASSSATTAVVPSLQAGAGEEICFKYMRQPSDFSASSLGDITVRIEVMDDAD